MHAGTIAVEYFGVPAWGGGYESRKVFTLKHKNSSY